MSVPNLAINSAPSNATPTNTTRQPNMAKEEQRLSQNESGAVMQKCCKRLKIAKLGTSIALVLYAVLLIIGLFIGKTTTKTSLKTNNKSVTKTLDRIK